MCVELNRNAQVFPMRHRRHEELEMSFPGCLAESDSNSLSLKKALGMDGREGWYRKDLGLSLALSD